MAKIKILFLSICMPIGLSWANPNSGNLTSSSQKVVQVAKSQLGVKERTGKNDGEAVERYLRYTNLPKGHPWCAAFVSWVYQKAGFENPRTAWSPSLFPKSRLSRKIKPGFVYGLYHGKRKRIVHCGITVSKHSDWVLGIEGNTNSQGSIEGDGVYLKRRHAKTIHATADWITVKSNSPISTRN